MGVITISRECGSHGRTIGQKVAQALGYLYVDKELSVMVAQQTKTPLSEAARFDEQPEHPIKRVVKKCLVPASNHPVVDLMGHAGWSFDSFAELCGEREDAVSVLDEDTYVRVTREIMQRLADQENAVLIGRGGQHLLASRPDALHVRLVAPVAFRLETIMERDGLSYAGAQKQLRQVDTQRRRYLERHYGIAWDAAEHYHLILNTGRIGVEAATGLLVDAVRREQVGLRGGVKRCQEPIPSLGQGG